MVQSPAELFKRDLSILAQRFPPHAVIVEKVLASGRQETGRREREQGLGIRVKGVPPIDLLPLQGPPPKVSTTSLDSSTSWGVVIQHKPGASGGPGKRLIFVMPVSLSN